MNLLIVHYFHGKDPAIINMQNISTILPTNDDRAEISFINGDHAITTRESFKSVCNAVRRAKPEIRIIEPKEF